MNIPRIALLVAAITTIGVASAQTLYKLIDKNGKITYSESPPKNFDGKVIRMDVDPSANTATLPKTTSEGGKEVPMKDSLLGRENARKQAAVRVAEAREALEEAKKELEEAKAQATDADITYGGTKGKGTRPMPTEEFAKRIAGLEANVKKAEEAVTKAERDAR